MALLYVVCLILRLAYGLPFEKQHLLIGSKLSCLSLIHSKFVSLPFHLGIISDWSFQGFLSLLYCDSKDGNQTSILLILVESLMCLFLEGAAPCMGYIRNLN